MSTAKAKELRKNSTDAERALWRQLRAHRLAGYKFRRQQSIGRYIVDFLCFEKRLIVELDGGQHAEQVAYDAERTAWLQSQGFKVLRFWNHEVLQNTEAVLEVILRECEQKAPSL
jgi:very-short-patch-repair endonuclease